MGSNRHQRVKGNMVLSLRQGSCGKGGNRVKADEYLLLFVLATGFGYLMFTAARWLFRLLVIVAN